MDLLAEMVAFAREAAPNEACGLIVVGEQRSRLVRSRNVSDTPTRTFEISEEAWLEVQEGEEVVGIFHSHPSDPPTPSMADLSMCEASGMPWHIVDLNGGYTCTNPSGFKAPYLKRPYVHGVHDCYSLVRDWYNWEWNLDLSDYERVDGWWSKGDNLYVDHYEECGFVSIPRQSPQIGDAFLFSVGSKVPNHSAIYVGNGEILHHVRNRLSTRELYAGVWQRVTTHQLRHRSRITNG